METNDYMELLGICDYQYVLDKGYFSDDNAEDILALENLMREHGMLKSVSVREALVLLSKVTRTHFQDGTEIRHDIPRKTRKLIKALGLQELFHDYREFREQEQGG